MKIENKYSDAQVSQNLMMKTMHKIMNIKPNWQLYTFRLRDFLFTGDSRLHVPPTGLNSSVDFLLLLDEMVLENVVRATNAYALDFFCGPNAQTASPIHRWKDHTVSKLSLLIFTHSSGEYKNK